MKFKDISRLKINCKKHGKQQTGLLFCGDIVCMKCHEEYMKEEKKKAEIKEKKDKELEEKLKKSGDHAFDIVVMGFVPMIFWILGCIQGAIYSLHGWKLWVFSSIGLIVYLILFFWFRNKLDKIEEYKK